MREPCSPTCRHPAKPYAGAAPKRTLTILGLTQFFSAEQRIASGGAVHFRFDDHQFREQTSTACDCNLRSRKLVLLYWPRTDSSDLAEMPRVVPPIDGKGEIISPSVVEAIAGVTAGIAATLSVHPLDVLKTRMQRKTLPRNHLRYPAGESVVFQQDPQKNFICRVYQYNVCVSVAKLCQQLTETRHLNLGILIVYYETSFAMKATFVLSTVESSQT